MHTTSSFWVCDFCGNEASSGSERPDAWPEIELRYKNGRYGGWLFSADLCRECWGVVRKHDTAAKTKLMDIFKNLFGKWKVENQ